MKLKIQDAQLKARMNGKPEVICVESIEFDDVLSFTPMEQGELYTSPKGNRIAILDGRFNEVIMVEYRKE